jgi:hypothetical protein
MSGVPATVSSPFSDDPANRIDPVRLETRPTFGGDLVPLKLAEFARKVRVPDGF